MNTQRWLGLAALIGMLALGPGKVQAQYQGPYSSPVYSPYLNLFRSGGSITSNYYGLVRPQLDAQASLNQLQRQIQYGNQSALVQTVDPGVVTGQLAGFQTQAVYFRGAYFHQFGVQGASLPGSATSGQQRFGTAGLNTPGFYSTPSAGLPALPTTTRPPGQ